MHLRDYSDDDLLAELLRRRNAKESEEPIEHWCHDCIQFKGNPRATDTYNPCQKKHVMNFHFPEEWESPEDNGFYRRACPDFVERPPPPPTEKEIAQADYEARVNREIDRRQRWMADLHADQAQQTRPGAGARPWLAAKGKVVDPEPTTPPESPA